MQGKAGKVIPFPLERRFPSPEIRIHTLRVYLVRGPYGKEMEGQEIFRTLQLRGDQTLEDLHLSILNAFDREVDCPYEFYTGGNPYDRSGMRYVSPRAVRSGKPAQQDEGKSKAAIAPLVTLDSLELNNDQVFSYWLDMEEEWGHLIHVVSINPARPSEEYPALIEKVGDLPPPPADTERERYNRREGDPTEGQLWEEMLELLMGEFQTSWRQQIEDVPLKPNSRLKTALGKLPNHWLEGICKQLGFEGISTRKGRLRKLLNTLSDEERLAGIWRELPNSARDTLRWIVLENRGWVTIQRLSIKFGRDSDTTWWWHEGEKPVTPLGVLRLYGLAYVGKTMSGRRRMRIVCVPVELRTPLGRIIRNAQPLKDSFSLTEETQPSSSSNPAPTPSTPRDPDSWPGTVYNDLCHDLDSQDLKLFLAAFPLQKDTESLYTHMLERIRREPAAFDKLEVREFLRRMTTGCSAWNRLAAYKLGVAMFGKRFAAPAFDDSSTMIKTWARNLAEGRIQEDLF